MHTKTLKKVIVILVLLSSIFGVVSVSEPTNGITTNTASAKSIWHYVRTYKTTLNKYDASKKMAAALYSAVPYIGWAFTIGSIIGLVKDTALPTKNAYIKVKQYYHKTGNGIMLKDTLYIYKDKHYNHLKKVKHGQPYRVEI